MKRIRTAALSRPVAILTLAVSVGAVAGPLAWRLSGEPLSVEMTGVGVVGESLSPAPVHPDISALIALKPFGATIVAERPAVQMGENDLGLTLLGVTLGIPESNSRAIISDTSGKAQLNAVGAELAAGVTLTEISSDHVVVSVNGTLQTLYFPNALVSTVAKGVEAPKATANPLMSGVAALNRLVPAKASYFVADPEEATDGDSVIARYRAAIRQNPMSVMLRLGIEVTDSGYRVTKDTSQGVLNAGFRPGDVIKMVNGTEVGNLKSDVELFDQIASAGLAQVELFRGGEKIKLTFPLR